MKLLPTLLSAVGAAAMLAFSSGASAVPFTVTAAKFTPGLGYGIDRDETSNPDLLDVRFSTNSFLAQDFALTTVGQSKIFNFGSIDLSETDQGGGIDPSEMDHLDISATLTFTAPVGISQIITTTGEAFFGNVEDLNVDYQIRWDPVEVLFGNGGKFRIKLSDMSFSERGDQPQTVTITLLSLPEDDTPPSDRDLPEPASIALLGIGIGCVAVARRRRAKA